MLLIKNAQVFAPQALGSVDLLVAGGTLVAMEKNIDVRGIASEVYDAQGQWLVPGFVDSLVHIIGGGGEGGFATRTPELNPADAIKAGVTTMVGVLGTDATCRSLGELFGKTKALNAIGLNCYMHSGSYQLPVQTLTGDLRKDIMLVEPIIGVGEIAIADHRGSQPTWRELVRVASDARVAGMLAGKSGVVSIHVGEDESALDVLHEVVAKSAIPINQFYPTHIGRSDSLIERGVAFARMGGFLDFTTSTTPDILAMGERRASESAQIALEKGVPLCQMTFSSDAQGSLPHFNGNGQLDGLEVGGIDSLWLEVAHLIDRKVLSVTDALKLITENPAKILGLPHGKISLNGGANFALVDPGTLTITGTMNRGKWLMRDTEVLAKSMFER